MGQDKATPGVFTAEATAVDATGNTGFASSEFRFQTTGDIVQPTVMLTAPADGAELTVPTQIVGSASDETTLVRYVVEASPAGKDEFFRLASGNSPVTNGVFGTLDPTLLLNGTYDVRVVVEDASGNVTTALRTYEIDGQAKVGNFSISFEDLTIPVAGIPITITRTYDSRNKTKGDFGVGWTLAIKDLHVFESTILGRHWEQTASSGLFPQYRLEQKRPHTVTVRFPDGRLDTFNMVLVPNPQTLIPIDFPSASFAPAPGTLSSLAPLDGHNLIVYPPTTGPVQLLNADFAEYDPTRYKLTDKDGTVYVVNQTTGLETITDLNGNTITFGPNGIIHSAGKSVTFARDPDGRITMITDPMGHTIRYAYDFYGDLTSVTDQESYTTQFKYNTTHGLLEIVDPRGVKAARNEYDDSGRLVAIVDANGQRTEMTHDVAARREEIKDRLGHITVHEYDAQGNVIATTDALGNRTTFTYDSRDNTLSEADPLGHTTTYTYDSQDNVLTKTNALGNAQRFTYDARGRLLTATDARGNTITTSYDSKGNLTASTDASGNSFRYTYNASGNPLTVTDPNGGVTALEYDLLTRGQ